MKDIKVKDRLDFSLNAFFFPFIEDKFSAYYNSIIDLVAVCSTEENTTIDDLLTTQECIHRMMAFNPMHCYMRYIASNLYQEIVEYVNVKSSCTSLKPEDIVGQYRFKSLQSILEILHDSLEFIQEISALFGTVSAIRKKGWSEDKITAYEHKYTQYYEDIGLLGFKKFYCRFKYAVLRFGGDKHACGLVQHAMSPPWTFPVNQKLDLLASQVTKSAREDPIFSPVLRLERLLSIIEDCPFIDFYKWEQAEKGYCIWRQLKNKYNHLVKRPLDVAACYPNSNQCFLHVQNENPQKTLKGQCFDMWEHMCMNWQSSMKRGILTEEEQLPDNPSQPLSHPTFFYSDNEVICYGNEAHKKLFLLLWESLRQQIMRNQGLECPIKLQCPGFVDCGFAVTLGKIWDKSKLHANDQWTKPECSYERI